MYMCMCVCMCQCTCVRVCLRMCIERNTITVIHSTAETLFQRAVIISFLRHTSDNKCFILINKYS